MPELPRTAAIQRLTEIGDEAVRAQVSLGVQIALESNLAHLRSIKDTEHKWLDLHAILTLPAIGYLLSVDDNNPVLDWPLAVAIGAYRRGFPLKPHVPRTDFKAHDAKRTLHVA